MLTIQAYLQDTFGYSDFQIGQIRYTVVSILSEASKLILMGFFFAYTQHFLQYVVAITILLILRTCTGGLHFQHYISCLAVSFGIIYLGICQLPRIPFERPLYFIFLLVCVIINYLFSPVVSSYRPIPSGIRIQKSKRQSFCIITAYSLIMFVVPTNLYTVTGFWIILLQSFQLFVAKLIKKEDPK